MFELGSIQSTLALALSVVLFGVKAFAAVDCLMRDGGDFAARDTLSKPAWLLILVLSVAAHLIWWYPLAFLNLVGTVGALIYLAQLRGSSSSPW